MSKLIIEAELTDEQIAIIATKLGYQKTILTGKNIEVVEVTDIVAKNQVGEEIFDEDGKPVFIKNITLTPEVIENPQIDDEFVREYFVKMIHNVVAPMFLESHIQRIREEEQKISETISQTVGSSLSSKKE